MNPVDRLDGTRSSHMWADPPGSFDHLNLRAIYPSSNDHGIPDLPPYLGVPPDNLVAYNDRHRTNNPGSGDCVHFFLDDYRFETVWTKPLRPLSRLQRVGLTLTPDFSMWQGMPQALQIFQVYRSRWCGAWMRYHHIDVIPTVSWSDTQSYTYAFDGLTPDGTVATSTVGITKDTQPAFLAGFAAMRTALTPRLVLVYGGIKAVSWLEKEHPDIPLLRYPTRWEQKWADADPGQARPKLPRPLPPQQPPTPQ